MENIHINTTIYWDKFEYNREESIRNYLEEYIANYIPESSPKTLINTIQLLLPQIHDFHLLNPNLNPSIISIIVSSMNNMNFLDLSNNNINAQTIEIWASYLSKYNIYVNKLNISNTSITKDGIRLLLINIKPILPPLTSTVGSPKKTTIKPRNRRNIPTSIYDKRTSIHFYLLVEALLSPRNTKSLKRMVNSKILNQQYIELDLHDNPLGDTGTISLRNILGKNCTLIDLNISNNNIGNKGCSIIQELLQNTHTLEYLFFDNNIFLIIYDIKFIKYKYII